MAAILALNLAGCWWDQDEKNESVGRGPGPAAPSSFVTVSDGLGGTLKVARRVSSPEPGYDADRGGLPAGAFFDNSRDDRLALRDAVIAPRSTRAVSAPAVARYTGPARRDTLESRVVPGPVGPDLNLSGAASARDQVTGGSVVASLERFQRSAYDKASAIFSRASWGASRSNPSEAMPHPTRVTVHHTDGNRPESLDGSIGEMRSIQAFHKHTNKWADIGYHFVIDASGRVFEGRPTEILGAHVGHANWNNVGVAVMGNYDKQDLNEEQKGALKRLIAFLAVRYDGDVAHRDFIQGHMHYNNTDCPGRNINRYLGQLRSEVAGEVRAIRASGETRTAFTPQAVVSQG
jgi:hypothetical protein